MNNYHLYLASASPRRAQLLDQIGINYIVIKPEIDESQLNDIDPAAYTRRIAVSKAQKAVQTIKNKDLQYRPVLAADTAVVFNDTILGKPDNTDSAKQMLNTLSNNTHQVFSSICLIHNAKVKTSTQISEVKFKSLSDQEIEGYCESGEPFDKAGSYGIQGLGARFIKHLSGSYSGVMGLPLYELLSLLDNTCNE